MLTNAELNLLLNEVDKRFENVSIKVQELEQKLKEMQDAQVERPKTSTGRRKRVQQAKADA